VLVDTAGSRVDNVVAVYTGSSLSSLQKVASAGSDVASLRPATLTFNAVAGQSYHIAAASSSSASLGSLHLTILPGGQPDIIAPALTVTGPQSGLFVSNKVVTVTGTASDVGSPPTGVNKIVVTVNGCSTSASSANGSGSWAIPATLQPGLNNLQVVAYDEAGNASSPITIQLVYFVVGPGNDFFATATPLLLTQGTNSVDTSTATKETGEPDHAGNSGGKSVWWAFNPSVDGVLTLSTEGSSFDTIMAVYTGATVSSLTPVGSSDDAFLGAPGGFSLLNQAVHANVIYYIAVDGYGGASGLAVLSYSFVPAKLVHVTTTASGSGTLQLSTVNSSGGKSIQPTGSADIAAGTTIVVTPAPGAEFRFDSWSGAASSFTAPLVMTVASDVSIIGHFVPVLFSDDFESGTLQHLSGVLPGMPTGSLRALMWLPAGTPLVREALATIRQVR
jgi:hypothetical protein